MSRSWSCKVGIQLFGLTNVKGAVTSASALPEVPGEGGYTQSDIDRTLDHSHSRLTFRANLTDLTEAERRRIASHKTGEDRYAKVRKEQSCGKVRKNELPHMYELPDVSQRRNA